MSTKKSSSKKKDSSILSSEGPEAVRVTVVRWDYFIAYQTLIKPDNPIKHLNNQFTGINENDVIHVQTTIRLITVFYITSM
jgi:hypothetical protein